MSLLNQNLSDDQLKKNIEAEEKRARRRSLITTTIILGLIVAVVLYVGLSAYKIYKLHNAYERLASVGVNTKADRDQYQPDEMGYMYTYHFTVDGQIYRGSDKTIHKPFYSYEEIYYDPANPSNNRLVYGKNPYEINVFETFIVPIIITVIIGTAKLFWNLLKGRKRAKP